MKPVLPVSNMGSSCVEKGQGPRAAFRGAAAPVVRPLGLPVNHGEIDDSLTMRLILDSAGDFPERESGFSRRRLERSPAMR
jgi:hypothetical protein